MKLLFDQNLSPYLGQALVDLYPDSIHVRNVGLEKANDQEVWNYDRARGFTIASKDSDFRHLSFRHGHPPKVVWIQRGNCSSGDIEVILRDRYDDLIAFELDEESSFLALN